MEYCHSVFPSSYSTHLFRSSVHCAEWPLVLVYAGVEAGVVCDLYEKKVIVKAAADTKPETVLKQAQKVKKDAALWPKKETDKKEGGGGGGGGGKKN